MSDVIINQTIGNGGSYSLSNVRLTASTLKLIATNVTSALPHPVASATLDNCTIGVGSSVTLTGSSDALELLQLNGSTINDGLIDVPFGTPGAGTRTGYTYAEIDIGKGTGGATFENRGIISGHWTFNQFSVLDIVGKDPDATFVNSGVINASNVKIDVNMLGTGKISFAPPSRNEMGITTSKLEMDRIVGSGQTIDMTNDGVLILTDPAEFHATIKGFSAPTPANGLVTQDSINVAGIPITSVVYNGDQNSGKLTLVNSQYVVGTINFSGDYTHARFTVASNGTVSSIQIADFTITPTVINNNTTNINNTNITNVTNTTNVITTTNVSNTTDITQVVSITNVNISLRFIDTIQQAQAARLYTAAFGRSPDDAGLTYWTNALQSGTPLEQIAGGFLASAEAKALYGSSDNSALVTSFYENVLHRAPDATGTAYWSAALDKGTSTQDQVLVGFSESIENKAHIPDAQTASVARLYYATLGRAPDAAGLSFWTSKLAGGSATLTDEADSLAGSPEFQGQYGSLDNAAFVSRLYQNVLGRQPDAAGLATWTNELDAHSSRGSVVTSFSESAEFKDKFVTTIAQNGIPLV